jgi:hypothetical protein
MYVLSHAVKSKGPLLRIIKGEHELMRRGEVVQERQRRVQ